MLFDDRIGHKDCSKTSSPPIKTTRRTVRHLVFFWLFPHAEQKQRALFGEIGFHQ